MYKNWNKIKYFETLWKDSKIFSRKLKIRVLVV
jgi:hypothetical protein